MNDTDVATTIANLRVAIRNEIDYEVSLSKWRMFYYGLMFGSFVGFVLVGLSVAAWFR